MSAMTIGSVVLPNDYRFIRTFPDGDRPTVGDLIMEGKPICNAERIEPSKIKWIEIPSAGGTNYVTEGGFTLTGFEKVSNSKFRSTTGNFEIEIDSLGRASLGVENGERFGFHDVAEVKVNGFKVCPDVGGSTSNWQIINSHNVIPSVYRMDSLNATSLVLGMAWETDEPLGSIAKRVVLNPLLVAGAKEQIIFDSSKSDDGNNPFETEASMAYRHLTEGHVDAPDFAREAMIFAGGAMQVRKVTGYGPDDQYFEVYRGHEGRFVVPEAVSV